MKPSKIKNKPLSDVFIRSVKAQEKETSYSDGGGLSLLVHPNGYKYFQFRYTLHGKNRKIQIGAYPKIGLSKARELAEDIKGKLANNIDPNLEKRKERAFKLLKAEATFQVICGKWLKDKAAHVSASYHKKVTGMMVANCYPRLGKFPINEINTPMILETLKVMEKRGSLDLMGRVREQIGKVFDYAKEQGVFFAENPAHVLRRSVSLKKHHTGHYKTLNEDHEVGKFLQRLDNYPGRETRLLIKLQLLTATRPTEAREAPWAEFDFEKSLWTIPKERTKMDREHIIPLSEQALQVLSELKVLTGYSHRLFPSLAAKDGFLSEATARKALRTLWPEYRIHPHGFRHLFSTFANEERFHFDLVETALAHGDKDRVRGTYNRATYINERRKLAQWYADLLDEIKAEYSSN